MNTSRLIIAIMEFFCILIITLCGIVAFSNSSVYSSITNITAKVVPSALLPAILFVILMVFGILFVMLKNKGVGILAIAALVLALPSILSYNNIDLLKLFNSSARITTQISFFQMLSIGSLVITVYFLLDLIVQLKINLSRFMTREASPADVQNILHYQYLVLLIFTAGALLISLLITAVARGFEALISKEPFILSWWIIPVALFCIFVLAIYLYWITTRKNT
jgi:hypothetical protein